MSLCLCCSPASLLHQNSPRISISVLLLVLFGLSTVHPLPSIPSSTVASVQRRPSLPDLIRPSFCPPACKALFSALSSNFSTSGSSLNNEEEGCACECPPNAPAYLHTAGYCVQTLEECPRAIEFKPDPTLKVVRSFDVPVLTLPAPGGLLFARGDITWSYELLNHLGINRASVVDFPSCSISDIFIDSPIHRWTPYESSSDFQLLIEDNGQPAIMYNGTTKKARQLEGVIMQLKIACEHFRPPSDTSSAELLLDEHRAMPRMCIAFRITGECIVPFVTQRLFPTSHMESYLLALLTVALLTILFISCLAYHICWRMKKRQLIGDIQKQYLVQFCRQQQQQAAHCQPAAFSPSQLLHSQSYPSPESIDLDDVLDRQPQITVASKKKLYFSPEFFETANLVNPPAVAEQFLYDLRRMIDMAKERIRLRRHYPKLATIHEVIENFDELGEVKVSLPISSSANQEDENDLQGIIPISSSEESPRSGKSVDSGRESVDDSSGSSSDECMANEKVVPLKEASQHRSIITEKLQSAIEENTFEDTSTQSTPWLNGASASLHETHSLPSAYSREAHSPSIVSTRPTPPLPRRLRAKPSPEKKVDKEARRSGTESKSIAFKPSAIPVLPRTSYRLERPSNSPKNVSSAAPSLIPRLGHASPRPLPRSILLNEKEADVAALASPRPSSSSTFSSPRPSSASARRLRKGYTVFPGETMLNKSLPRRCKRQASNENTL